jgi:hypothetical protein
MTCDRCHGQMAALRTWKFPMPLVVIGYVLVGVAVFAALAIAAVAVMLAVTGSPSEPGSELLGFGSTVFGGAVLVAVALAICAPLLIVGALLLWRKTAWRCACGHVR